MTTRMPPLQPWPLDASADAYRPGVGTRTRRSSAWPAAASGRPNPALDLSADIGGRRVATPAGPAAGPHTQLAQNLALGWLAGARTFELKTVQILDQLDIPRPCIDMEHEGYNVEWSQELSLEQSLDEYAKGWLLLAVLRRWEPLRAAVGEPGDHAFELSVGYDLAGIRHERMAALIDGLRAAGPRLDALRAQIGGPFAFAARRRRRAGHRAHRDAQHVPRLSAGRDRGHRRAPHDAPRPGRDREAEPDAAGARGGGGDRP